MLRDAWGDGHAGKAHYLRHLRQKLDDEPARPRHLVTETGVGYRLLVD